MDGLPSSERSLVSKSVGFFDHSGRFQTGRGYSYATDTISSFEPYDEWDWKSGGAATGGS